MSFGVAVVVAVALLVGLPLLIVGLAVLGPVGWIVAAVALPLATLVTLLWIGRTRPGDPGGRASAQSREGARVEAEPEARELPEPPGLA